MSPEEYIAIALHALAQNKARSVLTTLGVIIGVMSVILLVALGEGAQTYIETEFAGLGSNLLTITPGKQETSGIFPIVAGSFRKLTHRDSKELERKAEGVLAVAPIVLGAGQAKYENRQRNTTVLGVTPGFEAVREMYTQVGRFITERDLEKRTRVCILGTRVKEELFGSENALNRRVSINRSKHIVVGLMEHKGQSLGFDMDDMVFIPLPSGQQMFHSGEDELFEIDVRARSQEDIPAAVASIKEILTAAHDYTEDFTVVDQTSMLGTFSKIFDALRFMLMGIAGISLLVGGIGIMNIMLVSVQERTREVGIRMAVGAKRRDIGFQFLIESVALSLLGGGAGVALAWIGTLGIRGIYPTFPVVLSAWSVLMAFGFSTVVGVFFGVYPALKAASVDPVEALRYE